MAHQETVPAARRARSLEIIRMHTVALFTLSAKMANIGNLSHLSNALGRQIEFSALADNRLRPLRPTENADPQALGYKPEAVTI